MADAAVPVTGDDEASTKILLDSPTDAPALGFADIGQAFATIIMQSDPRFAVGIFGGWGSGKTTLMNSIRDALPKDEIVAVEFNAWRFEREPQLLIPLLDTIRAALIEWSSRDTPTQAGTAKREKMRSIAARIGRVVRALATGLSADVGLPGAVTAHYDVGAALDALSALSNPAPGEQRARPQSLYVAAFNELAAAFSDLSAAGVKQVVIFVDDLDRCLPVNALEVLESVKLFFDLRGFVFVVGLDEDVIERAIRAKFADQQPSPAVEDRQSAAAITAVTRRLGREYVKKIFQVPYPLPAMLPQQLPDLLEALYREAKISGGQLADLRQRVAPYLGLVAKQRRVNPREVKRFINAYTLQTLIRPDLDRDTVLALQTIVFQDDWASLNDEILRDSAKFVDALTRYRGGNSSAFADLSPALEVLPPELNGFLISELAQPLIRHTSLDDYLSSTPYADTGSWTLEAHKRVEDAWLELSAAMGGEPTYDQALRVALTTGEMAKAVAKLVAGSAGQESSRRFEDALGQIEKISSRLDISLRGHSASVTDFDTGQLARLLEAVETARSELRLLRGTSVLRP